MIPDVDVLGALLSDWIRRNEYSALVVTRDLDCSKIVANLSEELVNPRNLTRAITQRHVFSLRRGVRNSLLRA